MEPGDLDRRRRQRQQRVPALVGSAPGMRRAPGGGAPHRPRRLAPDDDALLAVPRELTALEAQARVVGGEARDVPERLDPPLLVGPQQPPPLPQWMQARG